MEVFIFLGVIFLVVILIIGFNNGQKLKVREQTMNEVLNKLKSEGFDMDHVIVSPEVKDIAVFNRNNKSIVLIHLYDEGEYHKTTFDINELIGVEIEENGKVVSRVSNKSMIARASVGGILAGGVGAVIGGITAKQKSTQEADEIKLKFIVDDLKNPFRRITIRNKVNRYKIKYQDAIDKAQIWSMTITNMMKEIGAEVE